MVHRSLGKALRGKATPLQIFLAAILAAMLGFVPGFLLVGDLGGGFSQAPGLILTLVFLVLILNANLAVFTVVLVVTKLLSLPLLPVSFEIGRVLLDGPTSGVFAALVDAPVLAWFGLEYYATTGGLLVGLLFGLGMGWFLVRTVRMLRNRMADLEEGSERYQQISSRRSVRFLSWLFLGGGKGKKTSWRDLAERDKKGLPIRVTGLAVVLVACAGLWLGNRYLTGPSLRNATKVALEHWNGATVDLDEALLDIFDGQVRMAGLAMADPEQLPHNLFAARTLEFDVATNELLRGRFVIDSMVSRRAETGTKRGVPGKRVVEPAEPPVAPPPTKKDKSKTLEDYVQDAQKWKKRLQQVSRWLDRLTGSDDEEDTPESRDERVREAAKKHGLAMVRAMHLIRKSPALLIRKLSFDGIAAANLNDEVLDLHATNLSSNPRLAKEPMELTLRTRSGKFAFRFRFDPAQGGVARTQFLYKGLAVDDVAGQLRHSPVRGGTMDLSLEGNLQLGQPTGPWLDMPLRVQLQNTTLSIQGLGETKVDRFALPLGLRGPMAAPRVTLDTQVLAEALAKAGKSEMAKQLRARADKLLGEQVPQLKGLLDGQKTPAQLLQEAKRKAEEEAKKRALEEAKKKAMEEAKKRGGNQLKNKLKGLFGGPGR